MKSSKRLSFLAVAFFLYFAAQIINAQSLPDDWEFPPSLDSWSFSDVTNWPTDNGYLPISFTNLESAYHRGDLSTVSYSLVVDTTNTTAAWLQYHVTETNGATNLALGSGAVTFWFEAASWASASTSNGAGPGEWAELLNVGQWTSNSSVGYWGISLDAGGTNIYFASQDGNGLSTLYLSAPIAWNTNEWHFIALAYSATNTSLYLDANLVTNGPGMSVLPAGGAISDGFFVGSDSRGFEQARGLFDDIYTFAVPLDATNIENIYWSQYYDYFLNPYNIGNYLASDAVTPADYGTNLAVSVISISNNIASLLAMNTSPDVLYEIQSATNLAQPSWTSEAFVYGSELTNWTAAYVPEDGRPTLFSRVRSWQDSTGMGIPDWWSKLYGLYGVDPWTYDPSGDGYTYLQDFQDGFTPGTWNTPPAPQGLTVQYNPNNNTATVSWLPSLGPVQSYTVQANNYVTGESTSYNVPAGTHSYQDNVPNIPLGEEVLQILWVTYMVQAHYTNGDSAWTSPAALQQTFNNIFSTTTSSISAQMVGGQQGKVYLLANALPTGTTALRITRLDWNADTMYGDYSLNISNDIPVSALSNGVCELPASLTSAPIDSYGISYYEWCVQTLDTNNIPSAPMYLGIGVPPFYDGRQQMVQNLDFLLRAPTVAPFNYFVLSTNYASEVDYPSNYVYAGLYQPYDPQGYEDEGVLDAYRPFEENYIFHNYVLNESDLGTNGELTTGAEDLGYDEPYLPYDLAPGSDIFAPVLQYPVVYSFQTPTNSNPIAAILDPASQAKYTYSFPLDTSYGLDAINVASVSNMYYMPGNTVNYFGLPYVSVEFTYNNGNSFQMSLLNSNGSIPAVSGFAYPQAALPELQTVDYYFAEPVGSYWPQQPEPQNLIPGNGAFSPTNTTPLLCASFGQSVQIAGYAKQQLNNGNSGVYAYLGQYFQGAYIVDGTGAVTTNSAGIISPYGTFVPTNIGPAALVTMPNWNDSMQRTALVQVVSLNVDANHDGTMDFSFGGPDQTSPANPYRFWINDNHDWGDDVGDGIPETPGEPDAAPGRGGYINGTRDLVDFFPVCINIQSLLQSQPSLTNLSFVLTQADSALLYVTTGLTPTNYMDYLRNTNTASALAGRQCSVTVSNVFMLGGSPYFALDTDFLAGIRDSNACVILVESSEATTAPLVLEVFQGTNLIAQPSLYLSTGPVEQMFRQKNLVSEVFPNPNSSQGPVDRLTDKSVPNEPPTNDKNFVFVHGYNVNPDHARGNASDIFKRMYWSGSHAKFYGVTWYGYDTQGRLLQDVTANYHTNVYHAFQTASNFAAFLGTLTNGPTVVAAHSLGNMLALSALSDWNARMGKYFMIDAAVALEAVDGSTIQQATMADDAWVPYANRLYAHDWYNLFPTGDYRSSLAWNDRVSNFHSTDVYNFYSSGEEVLRNYTSDPPTSLLSSLIPQIQAVIAGAAGSYVWVWEEKAKGIAQFDDFLGSTHGGWRMNRNYSTNGPLDPQVANALSDSQLETNSFFDFNSSQYSIAQPYPDVALLSSNGSGYAQTNRNRILSDAIPALTLPVGANPVTGLPANRNFDMNTQFKNGWPGNRTLDNGNWHHSDFRLVAYTFTYPLFTNFVCFGNLK